MAASRLQLVIIIMRRIISQSTGLTGHADHTAALSPSIGFVETVCIQSSLMSESGRRSGTDGGGPMFDLSPWYTTACSAECGRLGERCVCWLQCRSSGIGLQETDHYL